MSKKTPDALADTGASETSNLAAALPASVVQPAVTSATTAPVPASLERPLTGGSYVRQADGSLVPNPAIPQAEKAEDAGCHFHKKPQGDGEVVA